MRAGHPRLQPNIRPPENRPISPVRVMDSFIRSRQLFYEAVRRVTSNRYAVEQVIVKKIEEDHKKSPSVFDLDIVLTNIVIEHPEILTKETTKIIERPEHLAQETIKTEPQDHTCKPENVKKRKLISENIPSEFNGFVSMLAKGNADLIQRELSLADGSNSNKNTSQISCGANMFDSFDSADSLGRVDGRDAGNTESHSPGHTSPVPVTQRGPCVFLNYKCMFCKDGRDFKNLRSLRHHISIRHFYHHKDKVIMECPVHQCSHRFIVDVAIKMKPFSLAKILHHMLSVHNVGFLENILMLQCTEAGCDFQHNSIPHMKQHRAERHSSPPENPSKRRKSSASSSVTSSKLRKFSSSSDTPTTHKRGKSSSSSCPHTPTTHKRGKSASSPDTQTTYKRHKATASPSDKEQNSPLHTLESGTFGDGSEKITDSQQTDAADSDRRKGLHDKEGSKSTSDRDGDADADADACSRFVWSPVAISNGSSDLDSPSKSDESCDVASPVGNHGNQEFTSIKPVAEPPQGSRDMPDPPDGIDIPNDCHGNEPSNRALGDTGLSNTDASEDAPGCCHSNAHETVKDAPSGCHNNKREPQVHAGDDGKDGCPSNKTDTQEDAGDGDDDDGGCQGNESVSDDEAGEGVVPTPGSRITMLAYRCIFCDDFPTFPGWASLQQHLLETHYTTSAGGKVVLPCPAPGCEKTFRFPGTCRLREAVFHLYSRHGVAIPLFVKTFPCGEPGCGKIYIDSSRLTQHVRYSHETPEMTVCDRCGNTLNARSLKTHLRTCTLGVKQRERSFKCDQCDKAYTTRPHLREHIYRAHSGKYEDLVCHVCSHRNKSGALMDEHVFRFHGENASNRTVLSCDLCDYQSLLQGKLDSHIRSRHTVQKFCCPTCNKVSSCISTHKRHMEIHENVTHRCDKCDYTTIHKAALQKHVRAQHGNKRHKCPHCQYLSGYPENILKHVRLKHKK